MLTCLLLDNAQSNQAVKSCFQLSMHVMFVLGNAVRWNGFGTMPVAGNIRFIWGSVTKPLASYGLYYCYVPGDVLAPNSARAPAEKVLTKKFIYIPKFLPLSKISSMIGFRLSKRNIQISISVIMM